MKKILGLDLGTNSIGWAVVSQIGGQKGSFELDKIEDAGSRIIPMDMEAMGNFDKGNLQSQTAERTRLRGARRLVQRSILRRERLHRVLQKMNFLPSHYSDQIDFEKRFGQFLNSKEPKLPYVLNETTGKFKFLFSDSYSEMCDEFALTNHELLRENKKIPHNWTLYYLRKKALTQKISKEELSWVLLSFNQKRGYYQQRGDEDNIDQVKEYDELTIVKVVDTGNVRNGNTKYEIHLSDGGTYEKFSKTLLNWEGKVKAFIVTHKVDKAGNESRSYSMPSKENDWTLIKKRTEKFIDQSGSTVGSYIYNTLLENPTKKIKGELIQTIERDRYRKELYMILEAQKEFHPEFNDRKLYQQCIEELYRSNVQYRESIADKDFTYLLIQDIIFYHRPLKSKKHLIDYCSYEKRYFKDRETRKITELGIRCIHKTHPLFEEFRLWQLVQNLKILDAFGNDISDQYLTTENQKVELFDKLYVRKSIDQKAFLNLFKLKEDIASWNYGDTTLELCSTRYDILSRIKKVDPTIRLTDEQLIALWHILYSVTDSKELSSALASFASKEKIGEVELFVKELEKIKPFDSNYGAYSEKAIKKILPLMRMGKYWNADNIDARTKERIEKLIDGIADDRINDRTREQLAGLTDISQFTGLRLHQACYAVYDRYSEVENSNPWTSPSDIDNYLAKFKQHSLRNPVVEQVITEALRTVRDIWIKHGKIDEIHLELGREMKNPKEARVRMTKQNQENEQTNVRIKKLLRELQRNNINVRPESPADQQRLKLYEEGVIGGAYDIPDEIEKIRRQREPSANEIAKYKIWLEQGYISPYTGRMIPLNKLFSHEYEIEHIIPQARYFDDSLSNKVICESVVNKDKADKLAYEYIQSNRNKKFKIGSEEVSLLSTDEYEDLVKRNFKNSPVKRKKLMLEDIPDTFIERQMNDTRYISKVVRNILSNIVREGDEKEAISKNVITVTGSITSKLKADWGLNDVWNNIVKDRFIRLNDLSKSLDYGEWIDNKFRTSVPDRFSRGFSKKRIDHRHHAMDAIVIACATRLHISYLNNESAKEKNALGRIDLRKKLCGEKRQNGRWIIKEPYKGFNQEVERVLKDTVVSIKGNTRIITKSTNHFQRFKEGKKVMDVQTKGDNKTIRRALHKDTVFGLVNLQRQKSVSLSVALNNPSTIVNKVLRKKIKDLFDAKYDIKQILAHFKAVKNIFEGDDISKVDVYYFTNEKESTEMVAVRKPLDDSFDKKKIDTITDSGICKILHAHLERYNDDSKEAFSPDGLDILNSKEGYLKELNNGKEHKPIKNVRISETRGMKFRVGETANKLDKFVEAAKGTNLFFAIYEGENGKRSFESIPLNIAIRNRKDKLPVAPQINEKGDKLLFVLSPNDFVYLPTADQLENKKITLDDVEAHKDRIYKMVSCTGNRSFFIPYYVATVIAQSFEFESGNKIERALTNEMIKEICVKISVDRLGKLSME